MSLVIIQADAPPMVPYMSRAISTIHVHEASGIAMSTNSITRRSCWSAVSSSVGVWRIFNSVHRAGLGDGRRWPPFYSAASARYRRVSWPMGAH